MYIEYMYICLHMIVRIYMYIYIFKRMKATRNILKYRKVKQIYYTLDLYLGNKSWCLMLEMVVLHHTVLFRLTRVISRFCFQVDYSILFISQIWIDHVLCARQYAGCGAKRSCQLLCSPGAYSLMAEIHIIDLCLSLLHTHTESYWEKLEDIVPCKYAGYVTRIWSPLESQARFLWQGPLGWY